MIAGVGVSSIAHYVTRKVSRMRRSEPDPPNPRQLSHRNQQLRERHPSGRIAIRVHILPKKLDLGITQIHHLPRLNHHRSRGPAPLLPTRIRHHAIRTELIAVNNRDVPAMRVRPRRKLRLKRQIRLPVIEPRNPLLTRLQPSQHIRQIAIRRRSRHQRHIRRLLKDPLALLLRHTPLWRTSAHPAPLVLVQPVEHLRSALSESTGVVQGRRRRRRPERGHALLLRRPNHLLRSWAFIWRQGFDMKVLLTFQYRRRKPSIDSQ
jgi:hypothetical protein